MYRRDILRNVGPKKSLIRFSTLTPFDIYKKTSCTDLKKRKRKRKSRKPIFKQENVTLFFD